MRDIKIVLKPLLVFFLIGSVVIAVCAVISNRMTAALAFAAIAMIAKWLDVFVTREIDRAKNSQSK